MNSQLNKWSGGCLVIFNSLLSLSSAGVAGVLLEDY